MRARREKGQSMVELAFFLPVLVLLLVGCLDLGRVFSVWMALHNATREGARYLCTRVPVNGPANVPGSVDSARERVVVEALSAGITITTGYVAIDGVDETVNTIGLYDGYDEETNRSDLSLAGNPVTVSAYCTVTLLTFEILGGKPITINAATRLPIMSGLAPVPSPTPY